MRLDEKDWILGIWLAVIMVCVVAARYDNQPVDGNVNYSGTVTEKVTSGVTKNPTQVVAPLTSTPSPVPTSTPTPSPVPTSTPTPTSTPAPTQPADKQDPNAAPKNIRKSYMSYKAITRKSSDQYKLQQVTYTGEYGIRQFNDRFCVAVGSAYTTKIGTYLDVVLKNGTVIKCILADCKADQHTDSTNRVSGDGSLVEFVVDTSAISSKVKRTGDVSYACDEWDSTVVKVIVYDTIAEFK